MRNNFNAAVGAILLIGGCSPSSKNADFLEADQNMVYLEGDTTAGSIPEGFPSTLLYLLSSESPADQDVLKQNIASKRLWNNGQTVRVCFFGGEPVLHELIVRTASEWEQHAKISFDFGPELERRNCLMSSDGFSHIRVDFDGTGFWSFVGTDSVKRIGHNSPSMNLQSFHFKFVPENGYTIENVYEEAPEAYKGVIRHEFGHAIGLLHEHQNTNLNCWNELRREGPDNVYDYYKRNYSWGRPKVERNLGLATLSDPDAVGGDIDPESVMTYVLPAAILTNGTESKCYFPVRKNQISKKDAEYVAEYYSAEPIEVDEFDLDAVELAAPPLSADDFETSSYFDRIIADLNSDEIQVRRDARVRLAGAFRSSDANETFGKYFGSLESETYRVQLGLAVALAEADPSLDQTVAIPKLREVYTSTGDPTLRKYLESVVANQPD